MIYYMLIVYHITAYSVSVHADKGVRVAQLDELMAVNLMVMGSNPG